MNQIEQAASLLGSLGRKRNTQAQAKASRENGKRGGRPKKNLKIVVDKPERLD